MGTVLGSGSLPPSVQSLLGARHLQIHFTAAPVVDGVTLRGAGSVTRAVIYLPGASYACTGSTHFQLILKTAFPLPTPTPHPGPPHPLLPSDCRPFHQPRCVVQCPPFTLAMQACLPHHRERPTSLRSCPQPSRSHRAILVTCTGALVALGPCTDPRSLGLFTSLPHATP